MKNSITKKRVPNYYTGSCDNCGKDLGAWKWLKGENTGCSGKCADEAFAQELNELNAEDGLSANLDKIASFK